MAGATHSSPARAPRWLLVLFAVALAVQLAVASWRPLAPGGAEALPAPLPPAVLRLLALGDTRLAAAAVVLWLQAFDDQPGLSIPFAELDYGRLSAWLARALALDPASDYPLLLAAQVYAQVPDPRRARAMLDFVHAAFLEDPHRRWRWLAHAAIVARHRLRDERLALRYARDIAEHAPSSPSWARQMHIFLLEDMGERERAKILLGALLASGAVTDPAEIRFLTQRLEALGGPP